MPCRTGEEAAAVATGAGSSGLPGGGSVTGSRLHPALPCPALPRPTHPWAFLSPGGTLVDTLWPKPRRVPVLWGLPPGLSVFTSGRRC